MPAHTAVFIAHMSGGKRSSQPEWWDESDMSHDRSASNVWIALSHIPEELWWYALAVALLMPKRSYTLCARRLSRLPPRSL